MAMSSATIDVNHPSDNPGMYNELQQGMEYVQEAIAKFDGQLRSRVLHKDVDIATEKLSHIWQWIEYIEDKTRGMDRGVQEGMEYIRLGMVFIQLGKEKCFKTGNQSGKLELLGKGKEDVKLGREYVQQGIKYIKEITSDMYSEVLPGPRFKDRQGKDFIREASGSGSTKPLLRQNHRFEDRQGVEFIRQTERSASTYPARQQDHIFENGQGMEYIRQAERSARTSSVRQQDHIFENAQAMEYIRQADRSVGTNTARQQDHRFKNGQGMEHIRQADRSASSNIVRQQDHRIENEQGMEYIRQADKSATNHVRLQDHGFEDRQGMEDIHVADPISGASHVF